MTKNLRERIQQTADIFDATYSEDQRRVMLRDASLPASYCARSRLTPEDYEKINQEVEKKVQEGNKRLSNNINKLSEELQLAAVQYDGYVIQHIKNPSEAVQLAAVKQHGYAIQFINNPSEAVQLAAVQQQVFAIRYINNPSEAVQQAAVQQHGYAIQFINNPSEAVILAAISRYNNYPFPEAVQKLDTTNYTENDWLELVQINPNAVDYLDDIPETAVNYAKLIL